MTNINVGMGETQVSKSTDTILIAPGLGSCIGLTLYDAKTKVTGMVHVVLPDSTACNKELTLPGKYADTALPHILDKMYKLGAVKSNLIAIIAGGAQMFAIEKGSNILNIGMRNAIAVKAALSKEGIPLKAQDTGGNKGRTVRIEVSTGIVYVRCIGQDEIKLGGI